MASPFLSQLQPFEEHQSPSPVEEISNPYELTLTRSTSPKRSPPKGPSSPVANTSNNLLRQLSGDPDNPPPAWQRRPSISTQKSGRSSSVHSTVDTRPYRSSSNASQSPTSPSGQPGRRRLNLAMTTARPGLPNGLFMHESPNASSTSLNDDAALTLPQPAFRRRHGGSNRSSISSSQELSSMTSEELWSMDHDTGVADMSNPTRQAQERPLTTVRRMSNRLEHKPVQYGLPGEIIWPAAPPPVETYTPPIKSRSVTSMASLRGNKRMSKSKRNSRQASLDIPTGIIDAKTVNQVYAKSTPVSPSANLPQDAVLISSTNSSSTSLASHQVTNNKSSVTLNSRPPSAYYSRDFLSSLAPREGGYAIAAQMGNGLGAVGTMSVEEKRRSSAYEDGRSRPVSRAPMSKSAGMGRWSLDGGEHYGRPYGTPSANTTSTSLSARGASTPEVSPPSDDSRSSYLPDGASPPVAGSGPRAPALDIPSALNQASAPSPIQISSSTPINPSPLSRPAATAESQPAEHATPVPQPAVVPVPQPSSSAAVPPPAPVTLSGPQHPALSNKKSKKELAKEAKAAQKAAKLAEKAEAEKVARQRAAAARDATLKRQADKEALKRKEKEEKEKRKAEKKKSKLKSPSAANLPFFKSPATKSEPPASSSATPPVPPLPAGALPPQTAAAAVPFPKMSSSQSEYRAPPPAVPARQTHASLPLEVAASRSAPPTQTLTTKPSTARLGMLGTIKKRLSAFGPETRMRDVTAPTQRTGDAPPPPVPKSPAQTSSSASGSPVVHQSGPSVSSQSNQSSTPNVQGSQDLSRIITPPRATVVAASPPPVQPSDLPPRSTSHTPSMGGSPQLPSTFASPQSFQTATAASPPQLQRSSSHSTPQAISSSPLTKTVSQDRAATGSPSSQRGASLRGPRPMPHPRSRPGSISTSSDHLHSPANQAGRSGEVVTPSTSAGSATSIFSHAVSSDRAATDVSSPFTSDAGEGDASRKNSGIEGLELDRERKVETPERGSSNETIHPNAYTFAPVLSQ